MIRKGDWVTQYSAGYWLVLDVIPKYADSDYDYDGTTWKKGDRLGDPEKGIHAEDEARQRLRAG